MANRVQRPVKPETRVRQMIEEAQSRLQLFKLEPRTEYHFDFIEQRICVLFFGGNTFGPAWVKLWSPELGKWQANMNGIASNRVGKPSQLMTPEKMAACP